MQVTVCLSSMCFHLYPLKCERGSHRGARNGPRLNHQLGYLTKWFPNSWNQAADLSISITSWVLNVTTKLCETGGTRVFPDRAMLFTRNRCVSGPANREPDCQLCSLSYFPEGEMLQLISSHPPSVCKAVRKVKR